MTAPDYAGTGRPTPGTALPSTVDASRPWCAVPREQLNMAGAVDGRNRAGAERNPGDVAEARDRSGVFAVKSLRAWG